MARLPIPGSDDGKWGEILNQYLSVALDADGELRTDTVGRDQLRLNSVTSHAIADESVTSSKLAPGAVTAASVGLGNVDNTSDADKPVSSAAQILLDAKIDGPDSSVDSSIARFDGTSGKLLRSSGVVVTSENEVRAEGLTITKTGTSASALFNRTDGAAGIIGGGLAQSVIGYDASYSFEVRALPRADILARNLVNGNTRLKIDSVGNVGINNITPRFRLEVSEAAIGSLKLPLLLSNPNNGSGTGTGIGFSAVSGSLAKAGILFENKGVGSGVGSLHFATNASSTTADDVTIADARMTIDYQGKIGIGTTTPTHTLTLSSATSGIAHYNTSEMTTNYERVRQYWSANSFNIVTEQGGSGVARPLQLNGGNTSLSIGTTTPSSPGLRIIRSGTGVESLVQITSAGLTATNVVQAALRLDPTISQAGSAGYTVLHIEATESSLGSGAKLLADFKANGVSKFSISNTGAITSQQAINTQTGTSYTLTLSDAGQVVTLDNASAISVTVPLHATTAYPIGTRIDLLQLGTGQVTVVPSGGVTIRTASGLKFYGQYAGATLLKLATDTWIISGNLTL